MAKHGSFIWAGLIALFAALLIYPPTHQLFISTTSAHPYIMGFFKFAILSIMGEFLAIRLVSGKWQLVKGILPKMLVWGLLGMAIVLMFALYTGGVDSAAAKGLVYTGYPNIKILRALYISAIMNLTFGPVFMAAHRITDTWIDARFSGNKISVSQTISTIDWSTFMKFVVGKTIPLFWIPAHTITFLLPDQYRVIFAASLSIFLGLILSFAKMKK